MHVAIIGSRGYPYVYSGYETFVQYLVEGLVARNIEVTVYCHRNLFQKRPKKVNGVNLIYFPSVRSKALSQLLNSSISFVHAIYCHYDVILVINAANGPFGLLTRWAGKPSVINVDGLEWLRPKWKGFGATYFKWAAKQACRFYDVIINDSDEMRRVYLKEFNRESVVIAYGGVTAEKTNAESLIKWNLKSGGYYLIVGRLIPDNNADILIDGFTSSDSSKKLVVVGDVPYQDDYAERIKGLQDQRLVFTGYVKESEILSALYEHAYGYLHGHEFGGTNPTMLQALACGSAILALNTPFNQEMLQNGKFGLFFEKNAESVKSLVNWADSNMETIEKMKSESHKGITKKYTWEHVIENYMKVFEGLVKNKLSK